MGRFLLLLATFGLTIIEGNPALAKGGHGFDSEKKQTVSRAGVPALPAISPSEFLSGCGDGRYRDAATRRCRGPADVGN